MTRTETQTTDRIITRGLMNLKAEFANRRWLPLVVLALAMIAGALPAAAQVEIDRLRPAPANGELSIENSFGSTVVIGWDRNEVMVRGTLAAGAEGLDFDSDREGTDIDVDVPESWFHASDDDSAFRTVLEIHAPRGSHVNVNSLNASVVVRGVRGPVRVDTVNGDITIEASSQRVQVETMTGQVAVRAPSTQTDVSSISGSVVLDGVKGDVEVETVSGAVRVSGSDVSSLAIETTTGEVSYRGTLAARGEVEIDTFSGSVTLTLPADLRARFELKSFSGEIESALGPRQPDPGDRFVPYRRLRFTTGSDAFEIYVHTHDADITVAVE